MFLKINITKQLNRLKKHKTLLHPVVFAIFPLLSFYANNITLVSLSSSDLWLFLIFNLAVGAAGLSLARLLLGSWSRAAVWAVVLVAVFFGFGHLQAGLDQRILNLSPLGLNIQITGPFKIALLFTVLTLGASYWWARRLKPKQLASFNRNLFFISLIFLVIPLVTIVPKEIAKRSINQKLVDSNNSSSQLDLSRVPKDKQLPDIYYILLDGYARSDYLKNKFGYDNSDFEKYLENKGFYIAKKSHSNYAQTFLSLPSTFSMEYINYLKDRFGAKPPNELGALQLLNENKAVTAFKALGYKYVHIGSTFGPTLKSRLSDLEVKGGTSAKLLGINISFSEFGMVYLQTTALRPAVVHSIKDDNVAKTLAAFERTAEVSRFAEPTLSLSHITVPHPPYIFDADGVIPGLTRQELAGASYGDRPSYKKQTIYTNKLAKDLISSILSKSSTKPIIIVASDHGASQGLGHPSNWVAPNAKNIAGVKERMANFEAFYFPDQDYSRLYPTITPVNIFRKILNQFFNQNLPILPDKTYFSVTGNNRLYEFFDVTKHVD